MKVSYDPKKDILRILVNNNPVEKTGESKPGVILDYDKEGNFVGLELLAASEQMQKDSPWLVELDTSQLSNSKVQAGVINLGGLDWEKATPEEIIADLRNSRIERNVDFEL